MVDCLLLVDYLMRARKVSKILFIGDYHQLPSVAPGNVLKDLIEAVLKPLNWMRFIVNLKIQELFNWPINYS